MPDFRSVSGIRALMILFLKYRWRYRKNLLVEGK
jgi:hypothetical protein